MTTKPEVKLPELPGGLRDDLMMNVSHYQSRQRIKESISRYGALCYEAGLAAGSVLLAASQNEARAAEESLAKAVQQREDLAAGRVQAGQRDLDPEKYVIAQRLRRVAVLLGLKTAVPETDEQLYSCMFSVLGMFAGKLERNLPMAVTKDGELCSDQKAALDEFKAAALKQSLAQPAQEPEHTVEIMLAVLNDKGGFDGWWGGIDLDTQDEIRRDIAEALRAQQPAQAAVPEGWKP